jgi:hypothetical protein
LLLGHRYYDPTLGRFLSRDPIKDGRNWYTYCENNPVPFVDPNGLQITGTGVGNFRRVESLPERSRRAIAIVNDPEGWKARWRDPNGRDQTDPCPGRHPGQRHPRYTDCGRFVHAVVFPDDPNFPKVGSWRMVEYVTALPVEWEWGTISGGGMKPGDVLLRGGHVAILVDYYAHWDGKKFVTRYEVAEASFGDHGPRLNVYDGVSALAGHFEYWGRPGGS